MSEVTLVNPATSKITLILSYGDRPLETPRLTDEKSKSWKLFKVRKVRWFMDPGATWSKTLEKTDEEKHRGEQWCEWVCKYLCVCVCVCSVVCSQSPVILISCNPRRMKNADLRAFGNQMKWGKQNFSAVLYL